MDPRPALPTETALRLVALGLILWATFSLLRPFFPIFIWATILAVALYPIQLWLERALGGRSGLAALVITIVSLLLVIGPIAALSASLIDTLYHLVNTLHDGSFRLPPLPPAIGTLPLAGEKIATIWAAATTNLEAAILHYAPLVLPEAKVILDILGGIAGGIVGFVLAVLLMGLLLHRSDGLAEAGRTLADRLAGSPTGAHSIDTATATIRGVSRGVVGVAVLQALLAGIVLQIAHVPAAGLLAVVILFLCLVQIGALPVLLPVLIWAWATLSNGEALFLTVTLVPIGLIDNVLKPLLMSRGLQTPAVVLLLGVIGGTLTAGLVGVFLGPIVLAVIYDLVRSWIAHPPAARP